MQAILQRPALRFLIVGGFSTIVNYIVYFSMFSFAGASYIESFIFGFLAGVAFGYIFNKRWTFGVHKQSSASEILTYFLVYCVSLIIGITTIWFLVEFASIPPLAANFGAILLTTCTNFAGTRYLVFKS